MFNSGIQFAICIVHILFYLAISVVPNYSYNSCSMYTLHFVFRFLSLVI